MSFSIIIAEHNPLTNGHCYLIEQTKKMFPDDKIIVIMSGNFVQRGEPSILPKYIRASHTIMAGADLVLELPVVFANSSAQDFAFGAIKIASHIKGAKRIVFGSESGDINQLIEIKNKLAKESSLQKTAIKQNLKSGYSYAKSIICSDPGIENILALPNNLLGIEYLKAIQTLNLDIAPITIKRTTPYNSLSKHNHASASYIRECLRTQNMQDLDEVAPLFTLNDLKNSSLNWDMLYSMISYKIFTTSVSELEKINGVTEGLEFKLKSANEEAKNLEELISITSSKRHPKAKIKRILINVLLGIKKSDIQDFKSNNLYLKVLASNNSKKDSLKLLSESPVPLLYRKSDQTLLNPIQQKCYTYDCLASLLYANISNSSKKDYLKKE